MQKQNQQSKTTTKTKRPGQSTSTTVTTVISKPNQNRKSNSNSKRKPSSPGLTGCATKYFIAVSNPWSPQARGACIPRNPCPPSQKVSMTTYLTVVIGINGIGFVAVSPCLASDSPIAWSSTATYAGSAITNLNCTNGGISGGETIVDYLMTPFKNAQLTGVFPEISGKIISTGVRSQYIGKLTDRNGLITCFHDPNHMTVATTPSNIRDRQEAVTRAVGSNPCELTIYGVDEREFQYPDGSSAGGLVENLKQIYPFSGGINVTGTEQFGRPVGAIVYYGAPGTTFDVEIIQHMEFVGRSATNSTPNVSDSSGFDMVTSALDRVPQILSTSTVQSFTSAASQALGQVSSQLGRAAVNAGANYLMKRTMTGPRYGQITELR